MRTYENFRIRWIVYQTKILAFRSNNNRFFPILNKQHINSNTFEMYHHDTRFSGFALFYLIKSTLTSYNFNGGGSSNVPGIPFESPECPLFSNIFKVLELAPPLKICLFQIWIFCCRKSMVNLLKNRSLRSISRLCARGPGFKSRHVLNKVFVQNSKCS